MGEKRKNRMEEEALETEDVPDRSEITEAKGEAKSVGDSEAMEAEEAKKTTTDHTESDEEDENKNGKRKIDSARSKNSNKKFKGADGQQVVKEVKEEKEEEEKKDDDGNYFMTEYEGRWIKVESLPHLNKLKTDAINEKDPAKKKRAEKIYRNAVKNAEKKLQWEKKQRELLKTPEERIKEEKKKLEPLDLMKYNLTKRVTKRLDRERKKMLRQGKKLPQRNNILHRMAVKAQKSQKKLATLQVQRQEKKLGIKKKKRSKAEKAVIDKFCPL